MSSYKELLQAREALDKQIAEAKQREKAEAVKQVRALVAEFGLTAQDLFTAGRTRAGAAGSKVAAKYRDPATGKVWTGRGKPPKWIEGQDRSRFLIA